MKMKSKFQKQNENYYWSMSLDQDKSSVFEDSNKIIKF